MTRLLALATALAVTTGCIYVDDNDPPPPSAPVIIEPVNAAPYVLDGFSGCFYDSYNRDDVWYFDASTDDPDGVFDVVQVWADVWDDRTGELVQSFELYPTDDPYIWYSDWLVSTTFLDCWYPFYSVDIVAYDAFDAYGAITILPDTY
jgi:hypothetical protein